MLNPSAARVLLIGWDAADWRLIRPLLDQGEMPHLRRLMQRGVSSSINTLFPAYSPLLWTSIATGKRAYKHGILGFTEPAADKSGVQPISNRSRTAAALWNIVSESGGRSLVIGWWPTFPAEPIDGVMVSDQFVPTGMFDPRDPAPAGSVHPPSLAGHLGSLRVHPRDLTLDDLRPFLPSIERLWAGPGSEAPHCAQLLCEAATIQAVATELLATETWNFSAVYFNSIDHFCHRFMRYHPPQLSWVSDEDFHNFRHVVNMCYQFHDMLLGQLLERAGSEATVLLMSDHGFRSDELRRSSIPMEAAGPAAEHREYGIFVAAGPGIQRNVGIAGVSLLDVAPTILTLLGLPTARDLDGRVLTELFQTQPEISQIDSWDALCTARAGLPVTVAAAASGEVSADSGQPVGSAGVLQQLIDLGYVDAGITASEHPAELSQLELDFNRGLSLLGGRRIREAAEQFQELWLRWPADMRMPIHLAQCLESLGQLDDMRRVIDHLEEGWGRLADAATVRVVAMADYAAQRQQLGSGMPADAAALLNSAWLTGPESRVAKRLMQGHQVNRDTLRDLRASLAIAEGRAPDGLEDAPEGDARRRIRHLLQRAWTLLQSGESGRALALCEECLAIDVDSRAAYVMAGRVSLKARRPGRALAYFDSAIERLYDQPEAHLWRAAALGRLKRPDEAIAAAKLCSVQAPQDSRPLKLISSLYAKQGDWSLSGHYGQLSEVAVEQAATERSDPIPVILPDVDASAIAEFLRADQFGQRFDVETLQRPPAGRVAADAPVIVVSGLPRSGTSLMMQMLDAGGVFALTDGVRAADPSNPRGYFEHEKSLRLYEDNRWLAEARNRAVKIVAPLFPLLPQGENYRVVLMRRDIEEVIRSQSKMLVRLGKSAASDAEDLRMVLQQHFDEVSGSCERHGIPVTVVDYSELMADAESVVARLSEFLGGGLQTDRMAGVVDATLYRERLS